jgi:hypothetical protein
MKDARQPNRTCPSIGLMDDADTSLGYPSNWNYCHRSKPIAPPRFRHQEEFCLSGKYSQCPVFLSQQVAPLPEDLRIPRSTSDLTRNNIRRNLVIALMVFIAVMALGWGIASQGMFAAPGIGKATQTSFATALSTVTATSLPLPTMNVSPPPTLTYTMTVHVLSSFITDTPTYTPTLYRTTTPSSTPSKLDVPFGTDYKFVIHKASGGERFEQFATQYNTSVEAIQAINYNNITNPLFSDVFLVIPVGFTDVAKLPRFVVYFVKENERGISVEMLAKRLRVNPLDLKYYNGWTNAGDRPLVGDYLLVPRPRPIP